MNKKVFKTLEYYKVIDMLKSHATSEYGREACHRLTPMTDLDEIRAAQRETRDAYTRITTMGSIGFNGIADPRMMAKRLEIGGSLNASELLSIASMLSVAKAAAKYGQQKKEDAPKDSLDSYFLGIEPVTRLEEEIHHCILAVDEFADDATPGLHSVRRSMAACNEQIRSTMNRQLGTLRDYLQDGVITMRDGRYCLPVKAEFKSHVPGMVHDQSSTGATLFIEPMGVVNLNNQLRELELKEQEEIEKLLAELSEQVAEHITEITEDFRILSTLDFIFAKGNLARDMKASEPVFNTEGIIHLKEARHPLLDKHTVVPIDITLGEDYDQLIVTGPNTGGKTVSIKTCGLLTLMGQAGLHIPALEGSRLGIFHNVYADIGDEQSIEQSLSTFSSHMKNIIRILDGVDSVLASGHDALVLFDELCAGTDPTEGAALATAILHRLHTEGIRTMATTHYSELKIYALSTPGVENACCEFSVETLSPTYRLLIGIPGKSNAFAISGKLGLPADIIRDAEGRIDEEDQSFEDLVADLEEKRISIEKSKAEIEAQQRAIEKTRAQLDERVAKLNASKDKILEEANAKAANILKEAKDTADRTIRNFNKYGMANPDMTKMEKERQAIGKKLASRQTKSAASAKKSQQSQAYNAPKPEELRIGERVKVISMNMTGTIHSLPDKAGFLEVQMGIMRTRVKLTDIIVIADSGSATLNGQKIPGAGGRKQRSMGSKTASSFSKAASISPEIKLIGMSGDEAISALDKYLDDAYLSHLKEVRVVHGKGTGVLRQRVHEYLRGQSHVKSFRLAEFGEGDAGVTLVRFKD